MSLADTMNRLGLEALKFYFTWLTKKEFSPVYWKLTETSVAQCSWIQALYCLLISCIISTPWLVDSASQTFRQHLIKWSLNATLWRFFTSLLTRDLLTKSWFCISRDKVLFGLIISGHFSIKSFIASIEQSLRSRFVPFLCISISRLKLRCIFGWNLGDST